MSFKTLFFHEKKRRDKYRTCVCWVIIIIIKSLFQEGSTFSTKLVSLAIDIYNLFVMNTLLLIILVRIYVAVCLGTFPSADHVCLLREFFLRSHVSLFLCILKHHMTFPIGSLNFSLLWREKLRSAYSSAFFSQSYIGSISQNYF